MEKIYENIINEGKATGKTIEAINAELKAAGANFHLNPDGGVANWTEDEMREGFVPAEFQSTRPVRGAPKADRAEFRRMIFQSTRPVRGAPASRRWNGSSRAFQSTRPVRGATGHVV